MRVLLSVGLLSLALLLAPSGARAQESLLGEWRVIELDGAPLARESTITLDFGADGRLSGVASCNRYGAGYRLDGGTLSFSRGFSTQMACPPPIMQQERRCFDLLQARLSWVVEKDRLTLSASDRVRLRAMRK
jgi:heat shock protein HslJ